jgi:hypothetical protein
MSADWLPRTSTVLISLFAIVGAIKDRGRGYIALPDEVGEEYSDELVIDRQSSRSFERHVIGNGELGRMCWMSLDDWMESVGVTIRSKG